MVIIGGGPGGYATALYGAAAGLSMAIVEMDKVGGTCLHRGLRPGQGVPGDGGGLPDGARFGRVRDHRRDSPDAITPALDFSVSQARKQQVVDQLFKGLAGLLKGRGVTVFSGSGTLLTDHRVQIAGNDGSTTRDHRHRRGAGRRLGAPDHPRVRRRRRRWS